MKQFVQTYYDLGIQLDMNAKTNADGNAFVKCPNCQHTRTKRSNQNARPLGVKVLEGYGACNHCGWSFHLLTEDYMKKNPAIEIPTYPISESIYSFFKMRGISKETVDSLGIKLTKKGIFQKNNKDANLIGKFIERNCIAFVYKKNGLAVFMKHRDADKNFISDKINDPILYNLDNIKNTKYAIITEGEFDVCAYYESGYTYAVSVPTGSAISKDEIDYFNETGKLLESASHLSLKYIDICWEYLKDKELVYISTDNDAAGFKLREELGRRIGKAKCKFIDCSVYKLPNEKPCKDANDVLIHHGYDAIDSLINDAKRFPVMDLIRVSDVWDKMEQNYVYGRTVGMSTGINDLDPHFRWKPGHLIGLYGHYSLGKTTFALQLALLSSIIYNFKWGAYLPENYPVEDVYELLTEMYIGKPTMYGSDERMPFDVYRDTARNFVDEHFFCVDREDGYRPCDLRDLTKELMLQFGINGFIIDPWNSLIEDRKNGQNTFDYLTHELTAEQRQVTANQLIKIICVHPSTPDRKDIDEPPNPLKLEGGAIWTKKMHELIGLHRRKITSGKEEGQFELLTEIHVEKTKNHKLIGVPTYGKPVPLEFDRKTNRFVEIKFTDGMDSYIINQDPIQEAINKSQIKSSLKQLEI